MSVQAIQEYQVGQVPRLTLTVTDMEDAAIDPTGLTFRLRVGTGDPTVYVYNTDNELVKDDTGAYYVDWPITQEGVHYYRWTGTGTAAGAIERRFDVVDSKF